MGEANTGRPHLSRIDNGKDGSMDDAMIGNTGDAPGRAAYFRVFVAVFALIMTLWAVIFFDLQRIHEASFAKSRDDLLNLTQAAAQDVEASVKEIDVTLLDLRVAGWTTRRAFRPSCATGRLTSSVTGRCRSLSLMPTGSWHSPTSNSRTNRWT